MENNTGRELLKRAHLHLSLRNKLSSDKIQLYPALRTIAPFLLLLQRPVYYEFDIQICNILRNSFKKN